MFLAICLASLQVVPMLSSPFNLVLFQLCVGLPCSLHPCGFQSKACFGVLFTGFLKVRPVHRQDRFFNLFIHWVLLCLNIEVLVTNDPYFILLYIFQKQWCYNQASTQAKDPSRKEGGNVQGKLAIRSAQNALELILSGLY